MSGQLSDILGQRKNKKHASSRKKKDRHNDSKTGGGKDGRKNPKAFGVSNVISAKRNQQRNLDKAQQKEVVPLTNREEALPPPSLVVVMGPKGVGKTTLIRSLVKIYTGQNLADSSGPVTVATGQKRRLTLFEAPLDLLSLTDLAKTADLVLLLIDASYGLEMETFEFLNLLQLHGFPKVVGVLTHLDRFKSVSQLQRAKKAIKGRFWTEIYKGAKLFDFLGVVNGKYRKAEVKRLSLHISRLKYRPLVWKNSHPFLLVDRVEDITPVKRTGRGGGGGKGGAGDGESDEEGEGEGGERSVALFGYIRGSHLKASQRVHLLGAGDFDIASLLPLPDPLPLSRPDDQRLRLSRKKDRLLYAPLANVGRVSMDSDGLFIDLRAVHYSKRDQLALSDQQALPLEEDRDGQEGTPMALLRSMQDVREGVDEQLRRGRGQLSLFANSEPVDDEYDREEEEEGEGEGEEMEEEDEDYDNYDDNYDDDEGDGDGDEEGEEDDDDEEERDSDEEEQDDHDDGDDNDNDGEEDEEGQGEDFSPPPRGAKFSSEKGSGIGTGKGSGRGAVHSSVAQLLQSNRFTDIMQEIYGSSWVQTSHGKGREQPSGGMGEEEEEEGEEDFFVFKKNPNKRGGGEAIDRVDSSRWLARFPSPASSSSRPTPSTLAKVTRQSLNNAILKCRFVTGGWKKPITARGQGQDDEEDDEEEEGDGEGEDDSIAQGDFEDLEANPEAMEGSEEGEEGEEDDFPDLEASDDEKDSEEEQEEMNEEIDRQLRELNAKKKAMFKSKFDRDYDSKKTGESDGEDRPAGDGDESDDNDNKAKKGGKRQQDEDEDEVNLIERAQRQFELQSERNRKEFGEDGELARHSYEGFRQGLYVRMVLKGVPQEFLTNFDPKRPVIVGGLLPSETSMGFITARVKKHRWHKKILKSNDPLIFSVGWRRYQSIPVYTTSDQNERERYLKYTPEHMHCTATFYGPLVAPNTGILAYQIIDNDYAGFRIALTGTALEQRATPQVVKKLKLTGTPVKVFKNTAFISGMFSSALEVAKFEHAKIKTVSGIRGAIKKAVSDKNDVKSEVGKGQQLLGRLPPGSFRATFEDKILLSDLVVCRLWVPVEIKRFYNPVLSLLSHKPGEGQEEGEGGPGGLLMRSTAQLRKDLRIPQEVRKDSVYKPVERTPREFSKLKIPAKLQEALPFASKPKQKAASNPASYLARRAVILEPEERKQRGLVQMLATIRKDKEKKRKAANLERLQARQKEQQREKERFSDIHREEKKRKYKEEGLESQRKMRKLS